MTVSFAKSEAEIEKCFPILVQLRPNLTKEGYMAQAKRQMENGYRMAYLEDRGNVVAVAGVRIIENFVCGRYMYVDDLVTDGGNRSKGYGSKLFDGLVEYAKKEKCNELHLDSKVHRFDAHRFYLRKRMSITAHHFGISLVDKPDKQ